MLLVVAIILKLGILREEKNVADQLTGSISVEIDSLEGKRNFPVNRRTKMTRIRDMVALLTFQV